MEPGGLRLACAAPALSAFADLDVSGAHVEEVHRRLGTVLDDNLHRVRSPGEGVPNNRVHPTQNVVGDGHANRRAPDADAHPYEIGAEVLDDGAQAVVSARAPADLHADGAGFEIQVVVDDRSEEHTSELQSRQYLVCRLLLEKKKMHTAHINDNSKLT